MASLAAYPTTIQRDRRRLGLRECRAAWLIGVTVREYREIETGELDPVAANVGADGRGLRLAGVVLAASEGLIAPATLV